MPLTARNPANGEVTFPFRDGITEAICRDYECAAKMSAVRKTVGPDDLVLRRAHWRHDVKNDACLTRREDRDVKGEWHEYWQYQRTNPEHVEWRHQVGDKRRIADIRTDYGFTIEVQHSPIKPRTIHARENFWSGKVIWLLDGRDGHTGGVDEFRGQWRWSSPMHALWSIKTLCVVDDGNTVHLLPPSGLHLRGFHTGADMLIDAEKVRQFSHQEFTDLWINSDRMPIGAFNIPWLDEYRKRQRNARNRRIKKSANDEAQIAARRDEKWDNCTFNGDRSKLIHVPSINFGESPDVVPSPHVRPQRAPGRIVFTCTTCRRGWTQSELSDALAHQVTHQRESA